MINLYIFSQILLIPGGWIGNHFSDYAGTLFSHLMSESLSYSMTQFIHCKYNFCSGGFWCQVPLHIYIYMWCITCTESSSTASIFSSFAWCREKDLTWIVLLLEYLDALNHVLVSNHLSNLEIEAHLRLLVSAREVNAHKATVSGNLPTMSKNLSVRICC